MSCMRVSKVPRVAGESGGVSLSMVRGVYEPSGLRIELLRRSSSMTESMRQSLALASGAWTGQAASTREERLRRIQSADPK